MDSTGSCKPHRLFLDIETYCEADLPSCGVYRYSEDSSLDVLLLGYAIDDDPVRVLQLGTGEEDPEVLGWLTDPEVIKVAHNATFERCCLSAWLGKPLPISEWEDTMIFAAMQGLPLSLDACGAALRLQDQKLKEGTALISYFCKPCKPTIANGGRARNFPHHSPEKWERFVEYNRRDVEVERDLHRRLAGIPIPTWEMRLRVLDDEINSRGVLIDRELVTSALSVDASVRTQAEDEIRRLTGVENPGSIAQLKSWLETVGIFTDTLDKAALSDLLGTVTDPTTRRVLQLRQVLGKTSTKKYDAMQAAACHDDRIRGLLQYYGSRTGRWAGRLVQVQNLPQNHLDDIGSVRELVRRRDLDALTLCYDSIPDTLSQLIRTALISKPGTRFLVADYSAIEARVIAYLAKEEWRMQAFRDGKDIYCASASAMFKVPVVKHGVNGHLRAKGKIAELACGYGGGVAALKAFGAEKMGLSENDMMDIVSGWRAASPRIPKLWRDVEAAARLALDHPGLAYPIPSAPGVIFRRDKDALRCRLPSGRTLSYWSAHVDEDGGIVFMAQNQTTRKWEPTDTWGGKLVENIVQAFARDCLAVALLRLSAASYQPVFHVHDEVIVEADPSLQLDQMVDIMGQPIPWAPGLLLRAEGYETPFYMKD